MVERAHLNNAPDMIEQCDDPEIFLLGQQCIEVDGKHYCAGGHFMIGTRSAEDSSSIAMMLGKGHTGLHWQHTVHGARQLAQQLLQMADRLEAEQAAAARAMLTATLGKGTPDAL